MDKCDTKRMEINMYREILNDLAMWKDSDNRKPLILWGAKSVGKTWIAKDFGEGFFDNYVILDLKKQEIQKYLLEDELNTDRLIKMLGIYGGCEIVKDKSFIILENIDMAENKDELIDFFCNNMKDFHICITTLSTEYYEKFQDKFDYLRLNPLSFNEFLRVNKEAVICKAIEENKDNPLSEDMLNKLKQYLVLYFFTGGMPEVVECWLEKHNIEAVKEKKNYIISEYMNFFNELDMEAFKDKVLQVFKSIGAQLLKDNKKFLYGVVKASARAREYSDAVNYLVNNNFLCRINRIIEPKIPEDKYMDNKSFELFMPDIGLLSGLFNYEPDDIIKGFMTNNSYMKALVEQFVFQELNYNPHIGRLYYWISDATSKIEFLFEDSGIIIPVEINIFNNTKAQSIKVYRQKYKPPMIIRITDNRFSMKNGIMELPMFSIWNL